MASEESWKEKYLRELDEADQRDKQWQAERNVLERMLVRTSLASEGQTPELDSLLTRIRSDLRKQKIDVEAWRTLQDQIDRAITKLDEHDQRTTPDTPHQISTSPAPSSDDTDLAEDGHRLRIARRVGQLLGQLLNQVTLEAEVESQARTLQQTLLSTNDWSILREGLNQVAELVIEAVTRSQREFEVFLKRLDERLETLRQHFSQQSDAQLTRQDDTATLDREIREELGRVSDELLSGQDLQSLKQSVSKRLEFIGGVLERFRSRDAKREAMLAEQLAAMQEKVAAMEAHSEQMQAQVRRERERALTDLLTQLPNREAWQERLAFEYNRWQRYRHPLSMAVIDIDLFKRVNDSYGHKAGDRVLQLVAREMKARLRNTDFIARFGGEEFVLLLPETGLEDARSVVNEFRGHVGKLPFHFGGKRVAITFSAGVSEFRDGDAEDAVFDRADRALYQAKGAGRNQVLVA
ncbi:GGDEF domain-containing protein [Marinobacter sp.]|uniref:GGDEF domain-containing protein n=1 Tax=Marinobacter sp. TaxID=50741 RepID=UPI0019EBA83E|nr:GGDEF domain-containing protein [Marinobacter sp.]MBE0484673.1 diguanylate cyclase [Marinobacter sp.]